MSHSNEKDNVVIKEIHHYHYYPPACPQLRYSGPWGGVYPPYYCEPQGVYTPHTFTVPPYKLTSPPRNGDGTFKVTC